jgi:hypothetical protein
MKKVPESQVSAMKEHNSQRNQNTAERVNKAIDKLKRKNAPINFETVAKEAGVSRATLYNNPKLKERIMGLRAIALTPSSEDGAEPKKTKVQRLEDTVAELRSRVRQLETDKKNLVVQLVDYEETKAENERLRQQLLKGVCHEE